MSAMVAELLTEKLQSKNKLYVLFEIKVHHFKLRSYMPEYTVSNINSEFVKQQTHPSDIWLPESK